MKTHILAAAVTAILCRPLAAGAQERLTGVEYLAGRADLSQPFEATLVLDDQELRVEQKVYSSQGSSVRTVFTIALARVTTVGASLDRAPGDPILAGLAAGPSPTDYHEYVTLTTDAGNAIEAVVFRVGRNQSARIAERIESAAQRAQEEPTTRPRARAARARRRPLRLVSVVDRSTRRKPADRTRTLRIKGSGRSRADRVHNEQT